MSDTRAALEAALADKPDDVALHAAYADFLIDSGDPRGEYIRLQLALETPDLTADQRRELGVRAYDLRHEFQPTWLGPLHPFVSAKPVATVSVGWWRGWVVELNIDQLSSELIAAIPRSPVLRLVRRLRVWGVADGHLRADELRPLFDYLRTTAIWDLWLSARPLGDAAVDVLIDSGLVERLESLSLAHSGITDSGAAVLATCPAVPKLRYLGLNDNYLSPIGIDALAQVGVRNVGSQRFTPGWRITDFTAD